MEELLKPIPYGFTNIDSKLGGFYPGELTIIGGRPGMGCTSFALNIFSNLTEKKYSVAYLSLRETPDILNTRIERMNLPSKQLVSTLAKEMPLIDFNNDNEPLRNIFFLEQSGILPLLETITTLKTNNNIDIVIIDSLADIKLNINPLFSDKKNYRKELRYLKLIAKALHIPIILLSSVDGKAEDEYYKLAYYASRETIADWIILLYRWDYYGLESRTDNDGNSLSKGQTKVVVGKYKREGNYHDININFLDETRSFYDFKETI